MISPIRTELTVTDNVPFGQPEPSLGGAHRYYALTLERPAWKNWQPGQFIMLRPKDGRTVEWARPLAICRVTSQSLVLFFGVTAECGTDRFAGLRSGDKVIVWGPLGTGFEIRSNTPTLLLARDAGIAPFAGYADMHPDPASLSMLFGHQHPSSYYPAEAMASRMDMEHLRDRVPGNYEEFSLTSADKMRECKENGGICLACGPMDFIYGVWKKALELNLPTQLLLSARMNCGVGACLGCSTITSKHWPDPIRAGLPVQTCTSGPVFWARDIDLDAVMPERSV